MITNFATSTCLAYNFKEPLDLNAEGIDPLFIELVATNAFQRLKSIRFLGGIDYLLVRSPNGARRNVRYTRYQHSLGVASLALAYCDKTDLPFSDRRLVWAAALLHDIGHAPLSHSLEPVFKEVFGLAHHQATEKIITGRVPLGVEVHTLLRRYNVDIERLITVISGQDGGYNGFFAGPINFDTIEGIIRARAYAQSSPNMLSPHTVITAALRRIGERDRKIVDEFWSNKDHVYQHVINSRAGVLADFACQIYMRTNLDAMCPEDYFITEAEVFRKLPGLRELLISSSFESDIIGLVNRPVKYTARRFYIEQSGDFFARDDSERYRQSKKCCTLLPQRSDADEPVGLIRDLFDDPRD